MRRRSWWDVLVAIQQYFSHVTTHRLWVYCVSVASGDNKLAGSSSFTALAPEFPLLLLLQKSPRQTLLHLVNTYGKKSIT